MTEDPQLDKEIGEDEENEEEDYDPTPDEPVYYDRPLSPLENYIYNDEHSPYL